MSWTGLPKHSPDTHLSSSATVKRRPSQTDAQEIAPDASVQLANATTANTTRAANGTRADAAVAPAEASAAEAPSARARLVLLAAAAHLLAVVLV